MGGDQDQRLQADLRAAVGSGNRAMIAGNNSDIPPLVQANRQNNLTIRKTRRCFKWNDQYYQMDIYRSPHPGLMLLETWSSLPPEQLQMPDFLTVKENVTGNPQYSMFNLSKQS